MNNVISVSELSYYLQTRKAVFLDFIREEGLNHLLKGGNLSYEDVPKILSIYSSKYGYNNNKWQIPEWLTTNNEKWSNILTDMYAEEVSFPSSLPPSQGKQIHDLILQKRPLHVVEIGCFIGISSVWIGSALEKLGHGHLCSIDLFLDKIPMLPYHRGFLGNPLEYARARIKDAGLSNRITFHQMKSGDYRTKFNPDTDDTIDFLYLDGDHTIPGCIDDFVTYYPYVKEGGCILLHDINPEFCGWHGPRYLLDNIFTNTELFHVTEIPTEPNFGMALVTKLKHCNNFPGKNLKFVMLRQYQRVRNSFGFSALYQKHIKPHHLALKSLLNKYT